MVSIVDPLIGFKVKRLLNSNNVRRVNTSNTSELADIIESFFARKNRIYNEFIRFPAEFFGWKLSTSYIDFHSFHQGTKSIEFNQYTKSELQRYFNDKAEKGYSLCYPVVMGLHIKYLNDTVEIAFNDTMLYIANRIPKQIHDKTDKDTIIFREDVYVLTKEL